MGAMNGEHPPGQAPRKTPASRADSRLSNLVLEGGRSPRVDNYALIRDAVVRKRQVIAIYHGRRRELCPHVLGTKRGRRQALFYQFGGESQSGLGPLGSATNWRCIPVDELSDVRTRDGQWFTADDHSRPETCVDYVDVQVAE
jgi:hypothetical protein